MQLNKLYIYKNNELLRRVDFKLGLNLIVDSYSEISSTGNSIGKTTLSRVIDYMFLSSGKDIYEAPEFKKPIPEVVSFIEDNEIFIILEFTGFDKISYRIGRYLKKTENLSEYYINEGKVDKKDYISLIKLQLFGLTSDNPSIRNLSHKFIRNTHDKMQNTTKFLHLNTKPDVYDQLYLFLFGFKDLNLLKDKAKISRDIVLNRKYLTAYRKPYKESVLLKMLKPLDVELKELQEKISNFDFKDNQELGVKELVMIQTKISELTVSYSGFESRAEYLKLSIDNLKRNITSVEGRDLYEIYEDAGVAISSELKRSYEDLVVFHNKVVANKVDLIKEDLIRYNDLAEITKKDINILQDREANVFKDVSEPEALKSIGQMYNNISFVREKIASVNTLLSKIENSKKEIKDLDTMKDIVVGSIKNRIHELDENIDLFNQYFGGLSKLLYNESYIFDLNFDLDKEKCEFDIASISPNSTGGKKKGELTAFDFAYINFINERKIKRPSFIIHDSIEDVDSKQIFNIFQAANKLNGQYIVSVLNDKISNKMFDILKEENVILELSENNKFFKIK